MKVSEAHVPDLSEVNTRYWAYSFEKHELEGRGYFCPRCGESRITKKPTIDEETGMVAWD